jgi:hypothetical protein
VRGLIVAAVLVVAAAMIWQQKLAHQAATSIVAPAWAESDGPSMVYPEMVRCTEESPVGSVYRGCLDVHEMIPDANRLGLYASENEIGRLPPSDRFHAYSLTWWRHGDDAVGVGCGSSWGAKCYVAKVIAGRFREDDCAAPLEASAGFLLMQYTSAREARCGRRFPNDAICKHFVQKVAVDLCLRGRDVTGQRDED